MANLINEDAFEVFYVLRNGSEVKIRYHNLHGGISQAAKDLDAPYVVIAVDMDHITMTPLWEVYEALKSRANDPMPGTYSLPLAVKSFIHETPAPAIMWARAQIMMRSR